MKRVSTEELQDIAQAERVNIEIDNEQGIAVATVVGQMTFYARLEDIAEVCS